MLSYEFIDPEVQIASKDFPLVESFLKETKRTQIGWHYFTDIAWVFSKVKNWPKSYKILDAGGGKGPLQYLLAEMGFDVVNIDMILEEPSPVFTRRYSTALEQLSSYQPTDYTEHLNSLRTRHITSIKNHVRSFSLVQKYLLRKYSHIHDSWRNQAGLESTKVGKIQWVVGNLCRIPEIETDTFDAVVSLSALEHIPENLLVNVLSEIERVLKPDARWAVTTSGTEKADTWLHDPSKGYCFSEPDLKDKFKAASPFEQNPENILQKYKNNNYLKNNLARFYFKSGHNGMPWGKWNPQYIPVGIFN